MFDIFIKDRLANECIQAVNFLLNIWMQILSLNLFKEVFLYTLSGWQATFLWPINFYCPHLFHLQIWSMLEQVFWKNVPFKLMAKMVQEQLIIDDMLQSFTTNASTNLAALFYCY